MTKLINSSKAGKKMGELLMWQTFLRGQFEDTSYIREGIDDLLSLVIDLNDNFLTDSSCDDMVDSGIQMILDATKQNCDLIKFDYDDVIYYYIGAELELLEKLNELMGPMIGLDDV